MSLGYDVFMHARDNYAFKKTVNKSNMEIKDGKT